MSVTTALRHSGLARVGLIALIVLAYLVYLSGILLQVGLSRLATEFPVVEVGVATVALIVGLVLVRLFFVTEIEEEPADEGTDE